MKVCVKDLVIEDVHEVTRVFDRHHTEESSIWSDTSPRTCRRCKGVFVWTERSCWGEEVHLVAPSPCSDVLDVHGPV